MIRREFNYVLIFAVFLILLGAVPAAGVQNIVVDAPNLPAQINQVTTVPVILNSAENIGIVKMFLKKTEQADFRFNESMNGDIVGNINNNYNETARYINWLASAGPLNGDGIVLCYIDVIPTAQAVSPLSVDLTFTGYYYNEEPIPSGTYPVIPGTLILNLFKETVNTSSSWNAEIIPKVSYSLTSLSAVPIPSLTRTNSSLLLKENISAVMKTNGISAELKTEITPENTVIIMSDVTGADEIELTFTGRRPGDVTNDGFIRGSDAVMIARDIVGIVTLSDTERFYADVNDDGKINGSDALAIARYTVGLNDANYVPLK